MMMADGYLDGKRSALAAYNALQLTLMRRFMARGGTAEAWCERLAPAFRRRYGWMLDAASRTTSRQCHG